MLFTEQFSNGITIISLYLNPMPSSAAPGAPPIEHSINQIMREVSLLYCLPDNPFFTPTSGPLASETSPTSVSSQGHAVQDAAYAYAGWIFAQHFCNRLGAAYLQLKA